MFPVILTDLDNTLYNWVDFFAPSFRGMLHALSRRMNVSEEVLAQDFKNVYKRFGSLEFSFSIQELDHCKGLREEEVQKLVDLGRHVFKMVRDKNLRPYYGVKETLEWCNKNGIKVVGVTNSPLFHAKMRLKQLHFDNLFYGLAAWEGNIFEDNKYTNTVSKRLNEKGYRTKLKREWAFPSSQIKPNPIPYLQVINDLKISHKNTYVIGDSIAKDLKPADDIGAITIWAKYGLNFLKENFDTLLMITHWDKQQIENTYEHKQIVPTHIIDSFSQIKEIIPKPQLNLF